MRGVRIARAAADTGTSFLSPLQPLIAAAQGWCSACLPAEGIQPGLQRQGPDLSCLS